MERVRYPILEWWFRKIREWNDNPNAGMFSFWGLALISVIVIPIGVIQAALIKDFKR
jgi:hypothetical protein